MIVVKERWRHLAVYNFISLLTKRFFKVLYIVVHWCILKMSTVEIEFRLSDCLIVRLSDCQIVRLSDCLIDAFIFTKVPPLDIFLNKTLFSVNV